MNIKEYILNKAETEYNEIESKMMFHSDKEFKDNYLQTFLRCAMKKYDIHKYYLTCNADDSIFTFKLKIRYKITGNFFIDYSEKCNSIRIYSDDKLYKPINIKDIVEYELIDESDVICSCKRGMDRPVRNFIYNRFRTQCLVLKLYYINENGAIVIREFSFLKDAKRNFDRYTSAIELFKEIFDLFDQEILAHAGEEVKNIEVASPEANEDSSPYNKLMELKKLYDAGIIDQATYEEKKKKLVDEL